MASAESQGKTIALVITIVLFVASSATAFYFFNQVATAEAQRAEATKKANETDATLRSEQKNYSELRGVATGAVGGSGDHAKVVDQLKEKLVNPNKTSPRKRKDIAQRAAAFTNLNEAVDLLNRYLKSDDEELAAVEENNAKLQNDLAKVSSVYQAKVTVADEGTAKKAAELKEQSETAAKTIEERNLTVDTFQARFQKKSADYEQLKRDSEAQIDDLKSQIGKITLLMDKARQQQTRGKDVRFNIEDGEIVQVQGGGAEAYINVGRADGAGEGLTFGIYGIDRSGFTQNLPKANLEIIRVLGDHRALAKILDYQVTQPVVPGDKIFNPIWDRGRKESVAILGIIDMDGDGAPDNDEFKHLVERWGGKVDAEVDLKTYKMVGRITTDTDWLIEGKIPEPAEAGAVEAADAQNIRNAILAATSKFRKEAQINGVRSVNIHNFLAYMGYRPVRKTQGLGEEDIYRQTIQAQKTRRIQPNPGDTSAEDEGIDVERVKRDLARKKEGKKAGEGEVKKGPKPKSDEGFGDDEAPKVKKKDGKKKTDEDAGDMDGKEKKKEEKKGKKKNDDDGF
jgi:hypothetical protein